MKKFSGLGYELILVLAALSTSLLTGCGPAVSQLLETSNANTATKPLSLTVQSSSETQPVLAEPEKTAKNDPPEPAVENRIPIQKSSTAFTYRLSSENHSGPGKDLEDRARLLVQAFKPGLDDSLDAAGKDLFDQLVSDAPQNETVRYKPQADLWGINPDGPIKDLERTGNLAWLNIALHHADNLICVLNDPETGRIVASTGNREAVWPATDKNEPLEGPIPRVAHLSTGVSGAKVMSVVNFILSHPQLHDQQAPDPLYPELLPSHIPDVGTTYLDRALVYLDAMRVICDFFVREGSYWEFDTTDPDNILGWWFNNSDGQYRNRQLKSPVNDLEKLAESKTNHPNGIQFSAQAFVDLEVSARPVNRALLLNAMFATTAYGLDLLDRLNNSYANRETIETYNRIVRHSNNTFRSLSIEIDEGPLLGINRFFQYGPARFVEFKDRQEAWYIEDATHLGMDFGALNYFKKIGDLYPANSSFQYLKPHDYKALTGTVFSRFFDLKANIVCAKIYTHPSDKRGERGRLLGLDENGKPHSHGDYMANPGCPAFGDWIGRYGSTLQQLAINAKILEMADERLRLIEDDEKVSGFVLQRPDTWPSYRFAYPFELKKLRESRAKYAPGDAAPNKYTPECKAPTGVVIKPNTSCDTPLATLRGRDNDAGQQVTYWIIGGNRGLHLELDPFSGELSLNKYYPLEKGNKTSWTLKVMVCDDGAPTRYIIKKMAVTIW